MKKTRRFLTVIAAALLLTIAFTSCNKTPEQPIKDPIEQGFFIDAFSSSDLKGAAVFDPDSWSWAYNDLQPNDFNLTGVNGYEGQDYTQPAVTVQNLIGGSFSMAILPGWYNINYQTTPVRDTDPAIYHVLNWDVTMPSLLSGLDITINEQQQLLGTPIAMTAQHNSFAVVVDIPGLLLEENLLNGEGHSVWFYAGANGSPTSSMHLKYDATGDFWYGIFDKPTMGADALRLEFVYEGVNKVIDLTGCTDGHCYIYISDFAATTTLNIPAMINEVIVVP